MPRHLAPSFRETLPSDKCLAAMFLLAAVPAGQSLAREPLTNLAVPAAFQGAVVPQPDLFSTRDFRPRKPSMLGSGGSSGGLDEAPMLGSTTVWQRLTEFHGHNRVRLLTLWEAAGGSVSLQAGRRGDPSLQWSSRFMNRGGATRGVFDQMLSISLAGAGRGLHLSPRSSATETSARSAKLASKESGTSDATRANGPAL